MPTKRSKRYRASAEKVDAKKSYPLAEAISVLKALPATKFDQTVTLSFRLGVDPKQSDQMVRGTTPLPHGSGKTVRVLVFAEGQSAAAAKEAGAEYVGYKDLIEKVTGGFQDFDVAIATPGAMSEVRKLGKVLGPRGLMPKPQDRHRHRRHGQSREGSEGGPRGVQARQERQYRRSRSANFLSSPRRWSKTARPSSKRWSRLVRPRPRVCSLKTSH